MSWREREHARTSPRKPGHDYSSPGSYFVTARIRPNTVELSEIANGSVELTEFGRIVEWCWHDLPKHYGGVELDAFVIMPNHVHGIIHLSASRFANADLSEIVRALKTSSSRRINNLNGTRGMSLWRPSFHDSIIESEPHLDAVRRYIHLNPERWESRTRG